MAATSIPLDITCHMGQGALALDPTSFGPGNGILHENTTLVVMCQHHGTFQLIAGSTDAIGGIVDHGKECWKWWQGSLHFMAYDKPGPPLRNQVPDLGTSNGGSLSGVGIHAASISGKQWCGCWAKWGNLPQACTFLDNFLLVDKNKNFKNQTNFQTGTFFAWHWG